MPSENEPQPNHNTEESKTQPSNSLVKKLKGLCPFLRDNSKVITVLRLSGVIGQAGSFKKGLTLSEMEEDIDKAFAPKNLQCVALQVNSPGGSPVQSELIFERIRMLSTEKNIPVLAFAEDVAASGGYFLACAGDEIYASKSSIIGSIGVISAGFGFVEAIKKLGIERRVYAQGESKSMLDPFEEEKQENIKILKAAQKDVHEAFKDIVRQRRGEKIKSSHEKKLFSGEFYSGAKALELGLIDNIGTMHHILKEKYGEDVTLVKISKPKGWLKRKFSMVSDSVLDSIALKMKHHMMYEKFGL